jgi:hypothetical protein
MKLLAPNTYLSLSFLPLFPVAEALFFQTLNLFISTLTKGYPTGLSNHLPDSFCKSKNIEKLLITP